MVGRRRAVFLDRDGVLNRSIVRDGKPYAPHSFEAMEIIPGVAEALRRLREAHFLNVIVTNQPDVGMGALPRATAEGMNAWLAANLAIDAVMVCFHTEKDNCACRKPRPGMIIEAAEKLCIDISESFLVGDRWRDVAAAHAAGCQALFIDYNYKERRPDPPFVPVKSLAKAATYILRSSR